MNEAVPKIPKLLGSLLVDDLSVVAQGVRHFVGRLLVGRGSRRKDRERASSARARSQGCVSSVSLHGIRSSVDSFGGLASRLKRFFLRR